jgi:hypothetical protein
LAGRKARGARVIEPLQHLRRRQFRQHIANGLIQLQPVLLDELHRGNRGHRLGHRGEPENSVGGHLGTIREIARAERAFV